MKSGGQIDGQMSSQSPVVWWYREVSCEVVGMYVEAVPVLGAESIRDRFRVIHRRSGRKGIQFGSAIYLSLFISLSYFYIKIIDCI
jgi:hypothetical protein